MTSLPPLPTHVLAHAQEELKKFRADASHLQIPYNLGWVARSFKLPAGLDEGWVLTPEGNRRAFLSFPIKRGRDACRRTPDREGHYLNRVLEKEVHTYLARAQTLEDEAACPVASSAVVMSRVDGVLWPARLMTAREYAEGE